MLPLHLVIDTNVLVSAAIKPAGLQRTVFLIAISKPARLYVSHPVLEEYSEVLARPELRIRKSLRLQLLQLIKNHGHTVVPTRQLEATTYFPGMRRRCACGLFGDWQSKTFSEILEENKGRSPTGVCQSCGASFSKVADCSTACINAGLTRRFQFS
jgi:hypothetical protein